MPSLQNRLFEPISALPLALFRILFGFLAAAELFNNTFYRTRHEVIQSGYTFRYYGFEWVHPLPPYWLEAAHLLIAGFAIAILLGWRYRLFSVLFAFTYPYTFLVEKSYYLNHDYLFIMLGFVMMCMPAERMLSLDARRNPQKYPNEVPRWTTFLLCVLMGVVYFYGGLAKLQADWLEARPLKLWLGARTPHWLFGNLLGEVWVAYFMAWGGMLLDLSAPFLLSFRRTRRYMLAAILFFHFTNTLVFLIGIFPWLSIGLSLLHFPQRYSHAFYAWVAQRAKRFFPPEKERPSYAIPSVAVQRRTVILLTVLMAYQLLMPFRQHLYPSDPNWSEEGHRFAWRMMLRGKRGWLHYEIRNPKTGETSLFHPRLELHKRHYTRMSTHPEMILQYAHHLADKIEQEEGYRPEIYAHSFAALNGRKRARFIDPERNLAEIPNVIWPPADWIMPHPDEQEQAEKK